MRQQELRVIVAEDQIQVQQDLVHALCNHELNALGASNCTDLDRLLAQHPADMLLLNVDWKHKDGTPLLNRLRGRQGLHIVVLSPHDDDEQRILAVESGADGYLVTPVNLRLLFAVIRRARARSQTANWRLQRSQRRLHATNGMAAALTESEACLLEALARANGGTVARRHLIEALGRDFLTYDERRLEVGISRLRKKIKEATGADAPLKSEWGLGYAFTEPCVLI